MRLSQNFTLAELTVTKTGLPNNPSPAHIANLQALCENVLQPVRNHFNRPVTITSGFRSAAVSAAIGGKATSQHSIGEAADFEIAGVRNDEIWHYIVNHLPFDQCIAEYLNEANGSAGWIHVSYREGRNRKQAFSMIGRGKPVPGLKYA